MNHKCPAPGCPVSVPSGQLACRNHWYSLPKPIRSAVWAAWDRGRGRGSEAHSAALAAAARWYESHSADY